MVKTATQTTIFSTGETTSELTTLQKTLLFALSQRTENPFSLNKLVDGVIPDVSVNRIIRELETLWRLKLVKKEDFGQANMLVPYSLTYLGQQALDESLSKRP